MPKVELGIGISRLLSGDLRELRETLAAISDAGLDFVSFGDHVSFHTGAGSDGLITAAALAMLQPSLPVFVSVFLLPLRHPVTVARQLATLAQFAPGRLIFGVGIGGEDRHEVEICGVDPATRGKRMDESLELLRGLLTGEPTTFRGRFFQVESAQIRPAPSPPVPIVVGGRSDAAIRRAGRFGDGWLGIWNSARRFSEAIDLVKTTADQAGRGDVHWQHGMQFWCGLDDDRHLARARLAAAMEQTYQLPFERFERYCPFGRPEDLSAYLAPYLEAGCTRFNLYPIASDTVSAVAGAAEVKRLLLRG